MQIFAIVTARLLWKHFSEVLQNRLVTILIPSYFATYLFMARIPETTQEQLYYARAN